MKQEDFYELQRLAQADAELRQTRSQFVLASCIGKDSFPNYADAMRAVNRMARRHQRASRGAHPYRCDNCGNWHLTGKR